MDLYIDEGNHVYFYDVLYHTFKRAFGNFDLESGTVFNNLIIKLIEKEES
jgi:hypothetical protein